MKWNDFDGNHVTAPMVPWLLNLKSCNIHNADLIGIHGVLSLMVKPGKAMFIIWDFFTLRNDNKLEVSLQYLK